MIVTSLQLILSSTNKKNTRGVHGLCLVAYYIYYNAAAV